MINLIARILGAYWKRKVRRAFPDDIFARSHAFMLSAMMMNRGYKQRFSVNYAIEQVRSRLPELREQHRREAN